MFWIVRSQWYEFLYTVYVWCIYSALCTINSCMHLYTYIYIIGAGKTTTFAVITGDLSMTSGSVSVAGYDIVTNLRDVSKVFI